MTKINCLFNLLIYDRIWIVGEEILIKLAKQGNSDALEKILTNYKPLAGKIARRYFLAGQDEDDLYQEAMIGLFKALQSFSGNGEFKSFATLCINRQIQSAVKTANRKKNRALNEYISLNNQGGIDILQDDDEDDVLLFIIPSTEQLPDDKLISKEKLQEMKTKIINSLSNYEKKVLTLYLKGFSYKEIGKFLNKDTKSIENALSRIKTKLNFLKN